MLDSIQDRATNQMNMVKSGNIKKHISKNSSTQTHKEIERDERNQYDFFVRTKFYYRLMSLQGSKL
ncbi:MAG: hypothetical protein NC131_04840 [Roseburia sp.]|nr:hypothetical protein [Roseburia sp.]